jgi:hypothetical protein
MTLKELVLEVSDYALALLSRPLSQKEQDYGWTVETRDDLTTLVTEWRRAIDVDPDPGSHNRRHMIRWFLDNSVDTDGVGQAVLAIDGLLGSEA